MRNARTARAPCGAPRAPHGRLSHRSNWCQKLAGRFIYHDAQHPGSPANTDGWNFNLEVSIEPVDPAVSKGAFQHKPDLPLSCSCWRLPGRDRQQVSESLAYWESMTARERGQNLRAMMDRYAQTVEPGAHAEPPPVDTPSTVAMVVLESGHYYQVRITPRPRENHWDLEAADFMLPRDVDLPDGPTPLLPGQPLHLLTAIVSGAVGTWHPRHALYCLWRWAQRRWSYTRDWSAAWRFHLDGRQQTKAIPPNERTAGRPTSDNLCPVLAIHQIRTLAAGQVSPAIHTEGRSTSSTYSLRERQLRRPPHAVIRHPGNSDALTFPMP